MLKLIKRLSTASLLGNFCVFRSCGKPSSCATVRKGIFISFSWFHCLM